MKILEGAIRDYTYYVSFHLSPHSTLLLVLSTSIVLALSYFLFFRASSSAGRMKAKWILSGLTFVSVLVAGYEWWYWGELNYIVYINVVPIILMDSAAAVTFHYNLKGILRILTFIVFVVATLLFVGNTIFGEIFPVNKLGGSGLHATT